MPRSLLTPLSKFSTRLKEERAGHINSSPNIQVKQPGLRAETDKHLAKFLQLDLDALLKEIASGKGDGEILQWVNSNAKKSREPWEIEAWSSFMDKRGPDSDAETLDFFREYVGKCTTTREDIKTWFEALELDDYVSFGGKP